MPRFQTLTPTTDHLEKKHYLHAITFLTFILWLQRCAHPKQGSIESPYVVSWRRNIHDYYSLCTLHTFKNKTCFTYVYDQHTLKTHDIHTFTYVYSRLLFVEAVFLGVVDWNSAEMLSDHTRFESLTLQRCSATWKKHPDSEKPTLLFCVGVMLLEALVFGRKHISQRERIACIYIYTVYVVCTANRVITCYLPPVTRIKSWSNWGLLLHRSGSSVSAIFNSNVEAMFPSTKTSDPSACLNSRLESSKHLRCVNVCEIQRIFMQSPGYWTDSWFIDF